MARSNSPLQRALRFAGIFAIAALLCALAGFVWTEAATTLGFVAGGLLAVFVIIVLVGLIRNRESPS